MDIDQKLKIEHPFRLLKLRISDRKIFKELEINFVDKSEESAGPYVSLILGPNGTGKSLLLRTIVDIFREMEGLSNNQILKTPNKNYSIIFQNFGKKYFFNNTPKYKLKDNNNDNVISLSGLPEIIIATSILLNDKFPVVKDEESDIYRYLGVRRTPSIAGTQSYLRRIVSFILDKGNDDKYKSALNQLLDFLGYEPKLEISFSPRYRKHLFTGNLNPEYLKSFFINWKKILPNRKTPPYGYHYFMNNYKNDEKFILNLSQTLDEIADSFNLVERSKVIRLDIFSKNYNKYLISNLRILDSLNLLRTPQINLVKNTNFGIKDMSSGEYHFLVSFLAILSVIQDNSLILLDEPEISLHADWQSRYISFLKKIFKDYVSCHFIIASHSHFFVSDLLPESSNLNFLRRNTDNLIECESIPYSTYGWSAENILYKVFNVRTVRNYYFEIDLRKLLSLISTNSTNHNEISQLITKLESHTLDENDPLRQIISEAKIYLERL